MTRLLTLLAALAGLATVVAIGHGYLPGDPLAFSLVAAIGVFFIVGAVELHRFRQASESLARALAALPEAPPADLTAWLDGLPATLRPAVRRRIAGEPAPLPGPALTPYLAGLLVLLGMLGTFLGMVVTLRGTGQALTQAADAEAIRASLAAPVLGLGLAFGCSVAGVAASAMLGLMSALVRRERQQVARTLDACIATVLRPYTPAHHRDELLRLLQAQAGQVPALLERLAALGEQIGRQHEALGERLARQNESVAARLAQGHETLAGRLAKQNEAVHQRLLDAQAGLQALARSGSEALAAAVDRSLQASLDQNARLAREALEPAVQATLAGLAREAAALQAAFAASIDSQVEAMAARADQRSAKLLDGFGAAQAAWEAGAARHEEARTQAQAEALAALGATLRDEGRQALTALLAQQQQAQVALERTAERIAAQGEARLQAGLAELERVVQLAAEAPRAAAEVISGLRAALSESLVRDNAALDERNRLLATLQELLDGVRHAGSAQREAIDALVQAAEETLQRAGAGFADTVAAQAAALQTAAGQAAGGAAEVASLGEGFAAAVGQFGQASELLAGRLQGIEAALEHSLARSDEQLAYYVAQAREIVELTLGAHKQVVDELQQATARAAQPAELTA